MQPKNSEASLVAQTVKNLPAMWETWVRSLGWEDSLEKERATHSSILAWRIPWPEESGGLWSVGSQRSDMTERLSTHLGGYPGKQGVWRRSGTGMSQEGGLGLRA